MSQNAFLKLIRQYRLASQRYRRSYNEQVNALTERHFASITQGVTERDQLEATAERVTGMVDREYGRFVTDWTAPQLIIPF